MTGTWGRPAVERVSELRASAEHFGDYQTAGLSDLDLLNEAYESVLREQIDTRDRYMTVLTSLRGHDDAVRTAAVAGFRDGADRYAQHLVRQYMRPYAELAYRAEQLPDRPGPRQLEGLRSVASRVQHQLADEEPPDKLIDPGDARHTLRQLRNVVGVLDGREGLDATDVLRLVTAALNDGPLLDLFAVADRGQRPHEEAAAPAFVGPGWQPLHRTLWHYQPDPGQAHVKAFPLGGEWYLDLWSSDGALLAWGAAPASEVAELAQLLTARAAGWATDRTDYAWRRFADTAEELRARNPPRAVPSTANTSSRASAARAAPARQIPVAGIPTLTAATPATGVSRTKGRP